MKKTLLLSAAIMLSYCAQAQQVLGDFTGSDQSEWPKVYWYRDTNNGWDEGLIKSGSTQSVLGRSGFGIHMHESKMFTFWSTGWNPLLSIQGGTGNMYMKGKVGIGAVSPSAKLTVAGGGTVLGLNASPIDVDGHLSVGDITTNSTPTAGNWTQQSTVLISGADFTTIGFHDSGSRVDFIRAGQGTIQMGYDGGWGQASIGFPGGLWSNSGNVLIGKTSQSNNNYKLDVAGTVRANEIVVNSTGADFVFDNTYKLRRLSNLNSFIKKHRHLPEIPSASQMQSEGMDVGELNKKLLQKVEELTLYLIEKDKTDQRQQKEMAAIKASNLKLQKQLNRLRKQIAKP